MPSRGKEICRLGEMIKVACREQSAACQPQPDSSPSAALVLDACEGFTLAACEGKLPLSVPHSHLSGR